MICAELRPSANGYAIDCDGVVLVASWPAPYFVLVTPAADGDEPMLIHCDDLEHALRHARHGGVVLDSAFEPVPA